MSRRSLLLLSDDYRVFRDEAGSGILLRERERGSADSWHYRSQMLHPNQDGKRDADSEQRGGLDEEEGEVDEDVEERNVENGEQFLAEGVVEEVGVLVAAPHLVVHEIRDVRVIK